MLTFALPPTPTSNANGWNIGGVGSQTQNSRVGHVDLMLFVSLSLALGSQRENNFQWNMGLTLYQLICSLSDFSDGLFVTYLKPNNLNRKKNEFLLAYAIRKDMECSFK